MDQDLIAVAAQVSPSQEKSKDLFPEWVNLLSESEKTRLSRFYHFPISLTKTNKVG